MAETEAEAYALANDLLTKQIEEYVKGQKSLSSAPHVIVKDVAGKAERLKMSRGVMTRFFLYVKKSDLLPAENTRILVQSGYAAAPDTVESVQPVVQSVQSDSSCLPIAWQQAVVDSLLACETLGDATRLLGSLHTVQLVKRFGAPDKCQQPDKCFWMVFDDMRLVTILGPGTDERTNFRTMTKDCLANYSEKTLVWFSLPKK